MAQETSRRDRLAIEAYEEHCKTHSLPITEDGRNEWVREWCALDEEQWQDAVDAERDQEWPQASETERGIAEISRSELRMQDDGSTEQFVAVGQGNQGFYYAVFTSSHGGDDYRWREGPPWSEQVFPTEDAAREAAYLEMHQVEYEGPYEPEEPASAEARDDNPSGEINSVFEFPDVGRHTQTGDGERLWILARGSIGRSEQGFHSRIEILHDYEAFNIAGFWDNPRTEAVTMDGIPQGWSAPFTTYEEASRDVKESLVEFDRRTAQTLQLGTFAGTGSYAHLSRLLAEHAESLQKYWPQAREPQAEREPQEPDMDLDR